MGVPLRVYWICLFLFGGSVALPSMNGYNNFFKNDNANIGGDQDEQLEFSSTEMLGSYGQALGYADPSDRAPVAPAIPQLKKVLTQSNGLFGKKRSPFIAFGLVNGMYPKWDFSMPDEPITFPLHGGIQISPGFSKFSTVSLYPGKSDFPTSEFSSYPTPPVYLSTNDVDSSIAQTFETEPVSSSGGLDSSQIFHSHAGVKGGSQSYSHNLYDFKYPSAEESKLPPGEHVQPDMWSSASYETPVEDPVFSSYAADRAQAAPTSNIAQTLVAEASGTKGSVFDSFQNLDTQADVKDASSYSPYYDSFKQPAQNADIYFKEVGASRPQAAPVESLSSPSYVRDLTVDSSSKPVRVQTVMVRPQLPSAQQLQMPQKVREPFRSTYVVQNQGGYLRGRKVYSKIRYSTGFPPPPPHVLKGLRRGKL